LPAAANWPTACLGGRYRELPGTPHQPCLEQPGQVADLVLAALAGQTMAWSGAQH